MPCESYVRIGTWPVEEVTYSLAKISIHGYIGKNIPSSLMKLLELGIAPYMPLPETMINEVKRLRIEINEIEKVKGREIPYGRCLQTGEIVFCQGKDGRIDLFIKKKYGQQLEPLLKKYGQELGKPNYFRARTPEEIRMLKEAIRNKLPEGLNVEIIPLPFKITPYGIKKTGSNADIENLIKILEESIQENLENDKSLTRQRPRPEKPSSFHISLGEIDPSEREITDDELYKPSSIDEILKKFKRFSKKKT